MSFSNPTTRRILLIAGSDSSGGAGIEADQRVLALNHCYALTAITALTCQTTTGVQSIHQVPTCFLTQTITAVWNDVGVDVVKIGMLASTSTARAISTLLHERHQSGDEFQIVLDPVIQSTSGALLLPQDAISIIRTSLLPLATIITPNIPEALLLVSSTSTPNSLPDLTDLAKQVWHLSGQGWVLLKGGHLSIQQEDGEKVVTDVLFDGQDVKLFEKKWVETKNTHGTGCSLASAVASGLAYGLEVPAAVEWACDYVESGIRSAVEWELGKGSGPIDHWAGGRREW